MRINSSWSFPSEFLSNFFSSGGRHLLTVDGSEEGSGLSEGRKFLIGTKLETEKTKLNLI